VGLCSRNLELEIYWIAKVLVGSRRYPFLPMPSRRQAIAALMGLLNPANKFDIVSLEDPRPGRAEVLRILRGFADKLRDTAISAWPGRHLARFGRPNAAISRPQPSLAKRVAGRADLSVRARPPHPPSPLADKGGEANVVSHFKRAGIPV
jgi:hypothetical protein